MYGLRHFWLNLNIPPKNFWCNMGYWVDSSLNYFEACQLLVLAVTNKLEIQDGDKILDVGYGCGDSCFFLSDRFDCQVTGITNEHTQWKLSQDRLRELPKQQQDRITLLEGSAVELDKVLMTDDNNRATKLFDHILSIDSAYHFDTRWTFIKESSRHLKSGGTLGLYDMVLHDGNNLVTGTGWKQQIIKLICGAIHLPLENLVDQITYQAYLQQAGYDDIHFEPLSSTNVFGGLSRHCLQQKRNMELWQLGHWQDRLYLSVSAFLFNQLATHDWLQPMIVKATFSGVGKN
ncbi:unnamed protein product [Absidia cylindrospora]